MALITIQQFTLPAENLAAGNSYVLRLWYNQGFLDSTGQAVAPGTSTTGTQLRSDATVSGGFITFDPFTVYSTLDAEVPNPQSLQINCQLFKGNTALPIYPFNQSGTPDSWIVPDDLGATISFEDWTIANQRITLANPPLTFYTAAQVDALIEAAIGQAALNQDYIIGDYASFAAAITAITPTGGTLVINQATTSTAASQSVPENITLRFTRKGSITVISSTTLTIAGPIDADASQIFFNVNPLGTEGTVLFTGQVGTVHAGWFGDCTLEMGVPLTTAIYAIKAVGGYIQLPLGELIQTVSVDGTDIPANLPGNRTIISGYGRGTLIDCRVTGGVGLDFTGSQFVTLQHFLLSGNSSFTPTVGILLARNNTSNSAGHNRLYGVETNSSFSVAALYNYASEDFRASDDCTFINNVNSKAVAMVTADNVSNVTSAYSTIPQNVNITAATNANPCVLTTNIAHGYASGSFVTLAGFSGTLGTAINGNRIVTVISPTRFSVAVDTTASSVYSGSGATAASIQSTTDIHFYGCEIDNQAVAGTADALYLRGVQSFSFTSGFLFCNQQAFVHIDADGISSTTIDISDTMFDGNTTASYGVYITGTSEVAFLSVYNIYDIGVKTSGSGGRSLNAANGTTLSNLRFGHYDGTQGLYVYTDTLRFSDVDLGPGGTLENHGSISGSFLRVGSTVFIVANPRFLIDNNIFYYDLGPYPVIAKTSDYTLTYVNDGALMTNTGAVGAVQLTLPTDPSSGLSTPNVSAGFYRDANFNVVVKAPAGITIRVGTSVTSSGGTVTLNAVGSMLQIQCITTTQWVGISSGSVTFA